MDTISFLSPMVKAIVDGRKTVTRRPFKTQPPKDYHYYGITGDEAWFCSSPREHSTAGDYFNLKCPYGKEGNILFINEPWIPFKTKDGAGVYFGDDTRLLHSEAIGVCNGNGSKWRSPKSLPKWASRFKLQVTNISAEKLHDLTDEDAKQEGMYLDYLEPTNGLRLANLPRKALFMTYWDLCYRKEFPWEADPWVWKIEFNLKINGFSS